MKLRFSMKAAACGITCALALGMMPAAAFATGADAPGTPAGDTGVCTADCTTGASVAAKKCADYKPESQNLDQWQGTWNSVGDKLMGDITTKEGAPFADAVLKIGAKLRSDSKKKCYTVKDYADRVAGYNAHKYTPNGETPDGQVVQMTIAGSHVTFVFASGAKSEADYEPFTKAVGCHGKKSELVYGFKAKTDMGPLNIIALQDVATRTDTAPHFKIQFFADDDGNLSQFGPNVHGLGFPKFYKDGASSVELANLALFFADKKKTFASTDEITKTAETLEESAACKKDKTDTAVATTVDDTAAILPAVADGQVDQKSDPKADAKQGKTKKTSAKKLPKTADARETVALACAGAGLLALALGAQRRVRA